MIALLLVAITLLHYYMDIDRNVYREPDRKNVHMCVHKICMQCIVCVLYIILICERFEQNGI